jgi:glyoxylase I family protein
MMRVTEFDKVVKFYNEIGLKTAYTMGEGEGRGVLLDTGEGNYIEIFAGGTRAPGEDPPEGAVIHFALRVPNTDEAYNKALAAGAISEKEPIDVTLQGNPPVPVRIAFCKGFNGEIIEFFQNETL